MCIALENGYALLKSGTRRLMMMMIIIPDRLGNE
jgi:hypothetical protein